MVKIQKRPGEHEHPRYASFFSPGCSRCGAMMARCDLQAHTDSRSCREDAASASSPKSVRPMRNSIFGPNDTPRKTSTSVRCPNRAQVWLLIGLCGFYDLYGLSVWFSLFVRFRAFSCVFDVYLQHCIVHAQGCGWEGSFDTKSAHMVECGFVTTSKCSVLVSTSVLFRLAR